MSRLFDDAQSEYLQVEQAVLSGTPLAMVCFFNINDNTNAQGLMWIGDKDTTNQRFTLASRAIGNNNTIVAQAASTIEGTNNAVTSSSYSQNTWHHGAAIFVANNDRRVFIDGGSKGTSGVEINPVNMNRTVLGCWASAMQLFLSGMLAEAAIYDLSAYPGDTDSDKADYFEANVLPYLVAGEPASSFSTGLIAYWELRNDIEDKVGEFDLTAFGTVQSTHPPMRRLLESSIAATSNVSGSLNVLIELGSSLVEISAVSASLGQFEISTLFVGIIIGSSNIFGFLNSQPGIISFVIGTSNISGNLNIATQFISSLVTVSNIFANLNITIQLISSFTGIFSVSASLDSQPEIISFIATTTNVFGSFNIITQLVSSSIGISDCSGDISGLETNLISSIAVTSNISGSLNVLTELGSSIVEISGASASLGSLGVLTLLVAPSDEISNVSGWLGFLIFVEGTSAGISGSSASLDSQPGCEGLIIGASTLLGYLDLIPDFEAATLFWRPQDNIIETLEWKTEILKAKDGTEQRIRVRQSPRQYFKLRLYLESDKINTWYDSIIHTWQKQAWLIPIWTEYVKHTTDIDHHDTVIVVDTTNADFRNDSKAIIWKSSTEYEVVVIDTKTDSQLNLGYSVLNSFTGDKYIIPVRTAYIISSSNKEKYNSEISFVDLIFAIYDNDISIDEYVPDMQYDGYVVLNIPAFMDGTFTENSNADIIITDFETGIFKVESYSNFNFLTQTHIFFNDTKETCWNFRKFLYSLNGRQKTILIPTFRNDLIQTDNILALDTSVKIENIGLAENMGFNSLRTFIGFYFPDGTLIIRKITNISGPTELEPTKEEINFDSNLGLSTIVKPEDCKICFVDKCRLASDKVEIQWPYAHRNECRTNFMRVS